MPKQPLITCGIYLYDSISGKLLICHATNASWKTWSIPKGLKDENEDAYTAASRELMEETGINMKQLEILSVRDLPPVKYKKQNKILESFLIITKIPIAGLKLTCSSMVNADTPEIDKWAWIAPQEMKTKLHESQLENYDLIMKLLEEFQEK